MKEKRLRKLMAEKIVAFEARRDKNGNIIVYELPEEDGGGDYEVAGINTRFHPSAFRKLSKLIKEKDHRAVEEYVTEYIATYTDRAMQWTSNPSIEFFLRDCIFNRGPRGAAKILQIAINYLIGQVSKESQLVVDGIVGTKTLSFVKMLEGQTENFLKALRFAREFYEERHVGKREKFWKGFVARWDEEVKFAKQLHDMEENPSLQKESINHKNAAKITARQTIRREQRKNTAMLRHMNLVQK